jgi:23S rRNA G2445 N2-methylase RlmL
MTGRTRIDNLLLLGLGGSNKVMAGELSRLARRAFSQERSKQILEKPPRKMGPGGLAYPFAPDVAALAVMYHRTSARVLWGLYQSEQTRLEPLYDDLVEAVAADERGLLKEGTSFSILAFHPDSVEAGERQVVGVVKNALIDGAAKRGIRLRVDAEHPDLIFHARSVRDEQERGALVVSLDLAGRPMHERGYRTHAGPAPLREDLAANLVMLSRFDGRSECFIDPLAGSGTLAVEAALMAAGKPIWMSGRSPQAASMPLFAEAFEQLGKPLFADCRPRIYAAEIDEEVYGTLDRSLATAGTSAQTTTFLGDFRDWDLASHIDPNQRGVILSNPPYGARLASSPHELRKLYRDLADWCYKFRGFRACFIVGEPDSGGESRQGPSVVQMFQDAFGGRPRVKKPISNGPLRAQFLLYEI